MAALRAAKQRAPILDALVAATAIVDGRGPGGHAGRDYDAIPGVEVIRV